MVKYCFPERSQIFVYDKNCCDGLFPSFLQYKKPYMIVLINLLILFEWNMYAAFIYWWEWDSNIQRNTVYDVSWSMYIFNQERKHQMINNPGKSMSFSCVTLHKHLRCRARFYITNVTKTTKFWCPPFENTIVVAMISFYMAYWLQHAIMSACSTKSLRICLCKAWL